MARFDTAVGRYVYLTIDDVEYRVYFEEAGRGIPMILQHTAGTDGSQWRHLLADEAFQRDFRMIAYDLPYHGKSLPPTGIEWWRRDYRLTKDFLIEFVLGLSDALGLDRPVFMGSSIGGHLAADLAQACPQRFRAIIGLEAAIKTPANYDDHWAHPRIGSECKSGAMYGLTGPHSPEKYRRETTWGYAQSAPPVFMGDIYYYLIDHDLRETAEAIDTTHTPLYLLTGEYDWVSTPAMTEELARRVKGAKYRLMPGLGHFPMSEDPERFRQYIAPVLEEIRAKSR